MYWKKNYVLVSSQLLNDPKKIGLKKMSDMKLDNQNAIFISYMHSEKY